MICLRCGYCCVMYNVMILDNPLLGIVEGNILHKDYLKKCKHLEGDDIGAFSCNIHEYAIYKNTPCYQHSQIEKNENEECRIGRYQLDNYHKNEKTWLDLLEDSL